MPAQTRKPFPPYYETHGWKRRLGKFIAMVRGGSSRLFAKANAGFVEKVAADPAIGLRMVVNVPAQVLVAFLREGAYKNAYERPIVMGKPRRPSATRKRVDALIFEGRRPESYYFGAMAIGGTGIRFYGEYCLLLRDTAVPDDTQILDRNSYDLVRPPFSASKSRNLAKQLVGAWGTDGVAMATLKVLPELGNQHRLTTTGLVSDALLRDEDYVEVHRESTFAPDDLHEIREAPQDVAIEEHTRGRAHRGFLPTAEEWQWVSRRESIAFELDRSPVQSRVVSSGGRTTRWG